MPDPPAETRRSATPSAFATEALIREAIRRDRHSDVGEIWINEFSVPGTKERADLVLVGSALTAYEIKTERDDLRRLPRQVNAFSRLFDSCNVVVAEKHRRGSIALVPEWWGVSVASLGSSGVALEPVRESSANPEADPAVLVRLLWKGEVEKAVKEISAPRPAQASRQVLWAALLQYGSPKEIRRLVYKALRNRDGASARMPSNRFNVRRPVIDP